MKKKNPNQTVELATLIGSSINSQLNHSDLIGLIMEEQATLWENELAELNEVLKAKNIRIDALNASLKENVRLYLYKKSGIKGIKNPELSEQLRGSYNSIDGFNQLFREIGRNEMDVIVVGFSQNGSLFIVHSLQVKESEIRKTFKKEIATCIAESKEKIDILNKIAKLENDLSNRDRYESKISASITKNILGSMENGGDIASNMETIRKSIFQGKLLA